jgi:transcriptional regulator with XRE-family HTH domain
MSDRSFQAGGTLKPPMSDLPTLGEVIRRQRELSRLSMRGFARAAGISNAYLSQIERGLREPSQRVVEAIADSLETSAEALYAEAGIAAEAPAAEPPDLRAAVEADPALDAAGRRLLLDAHAAFVAAGRPPDPR